jgi:tight adherence protein B
MAAGLAAAGGVVVAHQGLIGRTARPLASLVPGDQHGRSGAPLWLLHLLASEDSAARAEVVWARLRAAVLLAVLATAAVAGWVLGSAAALAALAAPRILTPMAERRRARRRDAQLPAALERLAAALRTGSAPGPAFRALAASTPPPLGAELQAAAVEVEHGAPLGDALDRWGAGAAASPDVRLAAAALALAVRTGGAMARPVDRVAATLRERHELQAEVRALATQARASAGVLTVAPLGFALLVSTVEPGVVRFLLGSPPGLLCLLLGLGLQALGATWTSRILRAAS